MNNSCKICQCNKADKKNSHIIPSFLIGMVTSWDNSYKRDREILINVHGTNYEIYTGELPSNKIDELFDIDNLTEERINAELKNNTASEDNIFCSNCENKLARILESPYADSIKSNKNVSPDIAIFFWLSIIWRMSIIGNSGYKLSFDIETKLRYLLHTYLNKQTNNINNNSLVKEIPFTYRILWCENYCKNESGFIYAHYFQEEQLLLIIIGDFILCFNFKTSDISPNFDFIGCGEYLRKAPINSGYEYEKKLNIEKKDYKKMIKNFIKYGSVKMRGLYNEILDIIWNNIGLFGKMPAKIKDEIVMNLYDDNVKLGDRHTNQRQKKVIYDVLVKYGYIS